MMRTGIVLLARKDKICYTMNYTSKINKGGSK